LEIFENPSEHAPQEGDSTPIICEITPRTEQRLYRDGIRIQSFAEFFRLRDVSYQATKHNAKKVRVTGYLLWDDDHNGSAEWVRLSSISAKTAFIIRGARRLGRFIP
jgi:hypothetical protein